MSGLFIAIFVQFRIPWGIDSALVGVVLIQVGRLIKKRYPKIIQASMALSIVYVLMFSALAMINGYINMRTGKYGIWPLFYINAIGLAIGFWNIAIHLDNCMGFSDLGKYLCRFLYNIGHDSIVYLCLNQLAILITTKVITVVTLKSGISWVTGYPVKIVILIFVLLELECARRIVCNTPLKAIIGRR